MKKISGKDKPATKKDLMNAIAKLSKLLLKEVKEWITDQFDSMSNRITKKLQEIREDIQQFNRRNKLLEKDLIDHELRIKTLESQIKQLTHIHANKKLAN